MCKAKRSMPILFFLIAHVFCLVAQDFRVSASPFVMIPLVQEVDIFSKNIGGDISLIFLPSKNLETSLSIRYSSQNFESSIQANTELLSFFVGIGGKFYFSDTIYGLALSDIGVYTITVFDLDLSSFFCDAGIGLGKQVDERIAVYLKSLYTHFFLQNFDTLFSAIQICAGLEINL